MNTKTIKLNATLRDIANTKEITVTHHDGQTVADLLEAVREQHPRLVEEIITPDGKLTGLVHILVHGRNIHWLEGLNTPVRESDQLVFMPPSAGG